MHGARRSRRGRLEAVTLAVVHAREARFCETESASYRVRVQAAQPTVCNGSHSWLAIHAAFGSRATRDAQSVQDLSHPVGLYSSVCKTQHAHTCGAT